MKKVVEVDNTGVRITISAVKAAPGEIDLKVLPPGGDEIAMRLSIEEAYGIMHGLSAALSTIEVREQG